MPHIAGTLFFPIRVIGAIRGQILAETSARRYDIANKVRNLFAIEGTDEHGHEKETFAYRSQTAAEGLQPSVAVAQEKVRQEIVMTADAAGRRDRLRLPRQQDRKARLAAP
jgi:hypothetical protein